MYSLCYCLCGPPPCPGVYCRGSVHHHHRQHLLCSPGNGHTALYCSGPTGDGSLPAEMSNVWNLCFCWQLTGRHCCCHCAQSLIKLLTNDLDEHTHTHCLFLLPLSSDSSAITLNNQCTASNCAHVCVYSESCPLAVPRRGKEEKEK